MAIKVAFSNLWSKYPASKEGIKIPIKGTCAPHQHQCAIRLTKALSEATGGKEIVDTEYVKNLGPVCYVENSSGVKLAHARGAEELAKHLVIHLGKAERFKPGSSAKIKNRKGIVFFKDIAGFRSGHGDHIDLWDGQATRTAGANYSDICDELWFWQLK